MEQPNRHIKIVLDTDKREFHPGDVLSGYVEVLVNRDCRCQELELLVGWRISGAAPAAGGSQQRLTLFRGDLAFGEVYRYPFQRVLPNGPYTYRGLHLNVLWAVEATAKIANLPNMEAREGFLLTGGPTPSPEPYQMSDSEKPEAGSAERRDRDRATGKIGAILGALSAGLVMVLMMYLDRGDLDLVMVLIVGGMSALCFLGVLVGSFSMGRDALARMRMGKEPVVIENPRVRAGEWLYLTLKLPPASRARLKAVRATLRCRELTTGTDSEKEFSHVVFVDEHVLPESVYRDLDGELSLRHRFRVPQEAPPSFHFGQFEVDWTVDVEVEIEGWPDWSISRAVDVIPAEVGSGVVLDVSEPVEKHSQSEEDWQVPELSGEDAW